MSQSNAAAIRRRTNIQQTNPLPLSSSSSSSSLQQQPQSNVNSPGLTLPQVIALVDKRLIHLENFVKETKTSKERELTTPNVASITQTATLTQDPNNPFVTEVELNTVIDEFNHRFEVLATEVNEIKDMLLKLQTFTMEVNKVLFDERNNTLSGLDNVAGGSNGGDDKFEISTSILDETTNDGGNLGDN